MYEMDKFGFYNKAIELLREAVVTQQLSPHAQTILIRIAKDPHGILRKFSYAPKWRRQKK